jgi:transcriptional regulator with GAF, ATPase, and Fis domain
MCARTLASELPVHNAIDSLLEIVATYYNADRAYIFEVNYTKRTTSNTYEWTGEGISKEIEKLQNLPLDLIDGWMEAFEGTGAFYISSLKEDKNISHETYKILEMQNIDSLMTVPLLVKGEIVGFLGIDNQNGEITFNANDFHFKKLQLRASYAVPALWFPRGLELLQSKVVDPDLFITQTFPLEKIEEFFCKQRDDSSDVVKMVMVKE